MCVVESGDDVGGGTRLSAERKESERERGINSHTTQALYGREEETKIEMINLPLINCVCKKADNVACYCCCRLEVLVVVALAIHAPRFVLNIMQL